MEQSIDPDESSNSNSRFDHIDYGSESREGNFGASEGEGEKHLSERLTAALRRLTQNDNMKFMENFDPERSNRERRKLTRKIYTGGRKQSNVYDEKGVIMTLEKDLCDCLDEQCPGCHFPCPKCRSCKCAHECRQNRKWMYDSIEIEGTDEVIRNKFR
ncbi:hypothetical protein L9F63_003253 [Diploptera punctata]|uniref:ARF7 effector protein C-terminal domain-containing protein n=1 Tax=Diploptera punctata TaxID=6984 RepID=A0AAD8E9L2_DIPPU|nr:hypothetical protein L9F63_003253 [Diploptera punctata]